MLPIRKQPASTSPPPPQFEFNGTLYTKEDLLQMQSRIEVISPSCQTPTEHQVSFDENTDEPVPNFTSHSPKLLGYWAYLPESASAQHNPMPAWPDVRRAVQPGWCQSERVKLLNYLRAGYLYCAYCGYSSCRFNCRHTYSFLGTAELTDGEWVWPDGLIHYIDRHGVALPEEFMQSLRARQWTIPPLDEVLELIPKVKLNYCGEDEYADLLEDFIEDRIPDTEVSHTLWLKWADTLPRLEEVSTDPDPDVMQRSRLVILFANADGISAQIKTFRSSVIEKLCQRYGMPARHWDDEHCIDSISNSDLEQVVAEVMEGLRLYGLVQQASVICGEPSERDWQVDADRRVWPASSTGPGI